MNEGVRWRLGLFRAQRQNTSEHAGPFAGAVVEVNTTGNEHPFRAELPGYAYAIAHVGPHHLWDRHKNPGGIPRISVLFNEGCGRSLFYKLTGTVKRACLIEGGFEAELFFFLAEALCIHECANGNQCIPWNGRALAV